MKVIEDRDAFIKLRDEDLEIFTEEYHTQKEEKGEELVQAYLNPPPPEDGQEDEEADLKIVEPHDKYKDIQKIRLKYLLDQLEEPVYKARFEDLV